MEREGEKEGGNAARETRELETWTAELRPEHPQRPSKPLVVGEGALPNRPKEGRRCTQAMVPGPPPNANKRASTRATI